jgi:hypothetical protein
MGCHCLNMNSLSGTLPALWSVLAGLKWLWAARSRRQARQTQAAEEPAAGCGLPSVTQPHSAFNATLWPPLGLSGRGMRSMTVSALHAFVVAVAGTLTAMPCRGCCPRRGAR